MIFFDRSSPSSAICARTRIVAAISISRSSLTPLQYCNDANDQRRCEVKPRLPRYGSNQHRSRHGRTGLPRQRSALGIYEINSLAGQDAKKLGRHRSAGPGIQLLSESSSPSIAK